MILSDFEQHHPSSGNGISLLQEKHTILAIPKKLPVFQTPIIHDSQFGKPPLSWVLLNLIIIAKLLILQLCFRLINVFLNHVQWHDIKILRKTGLKKPVPNGDEQAFGKTLYPVSANFLSDELS